MKAQAPLRTALGIELGSTRIKAVLTDENGRVLATGTHGWENRFENGYWTYPLSEVWTGIQDAYAALAASYQASYGAPLRTIDALGISAMMHGYLPFDAQGNLLAPFRTWRNATTGPAAEALTARFGFQIPQRWSIAHLYQAMLNKEPHLAALDHLSTLACYVHEKLTGCRVAGVGEASGMFPIDSARCDYDEAMIASFDELLAAQGLSCRLRDLLPRVLPAGADAGTLTAEGALLLDPTGTLTPGVPCCPPEGDAGTGMVATNSIAPATGNVSAGTSVFAMVVLDRPLSRVYPEIDMVTTPDGHPVAMVHCNTCTSDLDAWVSLLGEMSEAAGRPLTADERYTLFYRKALEGEADCGGLVNFNYYAGEPITGLTEGRPLLVRRPDARLTLPNLARVQLYSAIATLKLGMDLLCGEEKVPLHDLLGHGGLFKVEGVGQKLLAGALGVPVSVMETAGEGGAWGMALLALYRIDHADGQTLDRYLDERIFGGAPRTTCPPDEADHAGFAQFMKSYVACLPVERAAVQALPIE